MCGCQEMGRDYFIGGKYAFSDNKIIKCVDHLLGRICNLPTLSISICNVQ
jgi:hypothetical protein